MENAFVVSLVVSGLGMVLLFTALAILYGLMYLMTKVLRDPSAIPVQAGSEEHRVSGGTESAHCAAVLAVALARARQESSPVGVPVAGEGGETEARRLEVSAWWALHHERQLKNKPNLPRSR